MKLSPVLQGLKHNFQESKKRTKHILTDWAKFGDWNALFSLPLTAWLERTGTFTHAQHMWMMGYGSSKLLPLQRSCPWLCPPHLPQMPKEISNDIWQPKLLKSVSRRRWNDYTEKGKIRINWKNSKASYYLMYSRLAGSPVRPYPQIPHLCMTEWKSFSSTCHIQIHISPTQRKGKSEKGLPSQWTQIRQNLDLSYFLGTRSQ